MEPLRELLATSHRQVLEFFLVGLKDVSEPAVDQRELLYNASVLAHHAQVSTVSVFDMPTPSSLTEVFDQFVFRDTLRHDSTMMETAGAQCLLLAGFFEDQMRRRHCIPWYSEVGAGFFYRAAALDRPGARAQLLATMAAHFETWRQRYARLGRDLRTQPYLLKLPSPSMEGPQAA